MNIKIPVFIVSLLLIILFFIPCTIGNDIILNNTIYVDDNNTEGPWDGTQEYPYKNIQDGINAANGNDTVFVYNGIYYNNININKPLNLIGESQENTIIHGKNSGVLVRLGSSNLSIQGFTIENSSKDDWSHGISCSITPNHLHNITIKDCILKNNGANGILLGNITNLSIKDVNINNNSGNSIAIADFSSRISIQNCSISNNGRKLDNGAIIDGGIFIYSYKYRCHNINISKCLIKNNIGHGIFLSNGINLSIINNTIINNTDSGIDINNVEESGILKNNIYDHGRCGIDISESNTININKNIVNNNGDIIDLFYGGILIQGFSKNILILNNKIQNNSGYGLQLLRSYNIIILKNNFINNGVNAFFLVTAPFLLDWDNNFWDKSISYPYPIFGRIGIFGIIPWVKFDWHPSIEPLY